MFRHKTQPQLMPVALDKHCNAVTEHLMNALQVNFLVLKTMLEFLAMNITIGVETGLPVIQKD